MEPDPPQLVLQHHIGFEDEEETLLTYLMEPTLKLDVISIVGMSGLGKTTMARTIFENPKVQYEFPIRIWVNASRVFNRRDVFLNILKQMTSRDMSSLSNLELGNKVHESLQEGMFFLVVDDVWSVQDWDCIRQVLPKSNRMSKVLITTRLMEVSRFASSTRPPFFLHFLTDEESWRLLQLQVFGSLGCYPAELEDVVKHIVVQCDGLPLALTVVGGILGAQWSRRKSMRSIKNEWIAVAKNLNVFRSQDQNGNGLSDIISMSYTALPHELRDCFLYLGVIPQDYEISAWTLTRLWIAEGFIQGGSWEETAEKNLMELIRRKLVMVRKVSSIGQVKTCQVPNVVRTFCISKAGLSEQNLFQEIKMLEHGIFDPPDSNLQKYRRLCIYSHLSEFISRNINGPEVRSLLCFYDEVFILCPEYISAFSNAFKLLRVMESKSIKFTKFPMKFTKLIHLRYLTLSCDDLDVLPEPVSQLWNLQTLVIETESPSLEVRANIWSMIQLRHFKTKASIILAVQAESNNASDNLQTLTRLSPESCTEQVLNRVPNLKTLGVRGQLTTLIHTKCLGNLDRLEKLKLVNDLFYESASGNRLRGLPSLPPNLKRLSLSATFLDWEHMSVLGKISTLEIIKLKNNAFTGSSWSLDGHAFPRLEFMLMANTDIVHWEVSTDCFPSLRCLVIKNCEKLQEIPVGLTKSLEQLDIERLNKEAVASAKKIEEAKKTTGRVVGFKLSIGIGCE